MTTLNYTVEKYKHYWAIRFKERSFSMDLSGSITLCPSWESNVVYTTRQEAIKVKDLLNIPEKKARANESSRKSYIVHRKKKLAQKKRYAAQPKVRKRMSKYSRSYFKQKLQFDRDGDGNIVYTLYYLPEHHYIGITKQLHKRLCSHRSAQKRITEGYEIVMQSNDLRTIVLAERVLHSVGYEGSGYKNRYETWLYLKELREHTDGLDCPF